jgi:hypothetical protein
MRRVVITVGPSISQNQGSITTFAFIIILVMNSALTFLVRHSCIQEGLCHPVWMEQVGHDDDTVVLQKIAKSGPIGTPCDMDNSLTMTRSVEKKVGWRENHRRFRASLSSSNRAHSDECRDTSASCNDGSFLNALRDAGDNFDSSDDLDEVIAKMIRTRDDLIQKKLQADEQVKQLGLENENLKNLVSIGKRVTQAQRDEITSAKIQSLQDKKRIKELEFELLTIKTRTKNIKNELDGGNFLDGFACHVGGRGVSETTRQGAPTTQPRSDTFFGW